MENIPVFDELILSIHRSL